MKAVTVTMIKYIDQHLSIGSFRSTDKRMRMFRTMRETDENAMYNRSESMLPVRPHIIRPEIKTTKKIL